MGTTKRLKIAILLLVALSSFAFTLKKVSAAQFGVTGKAISMNTDGYLDFNASPYNSNVQINDSTGIFSGYAWSEDLGWLDFGSIDNGLGPVNVSLSTGQVTGKALVMLTGGYLDFTNFNSNVTINLTTGIFSGYAWSEDIGWINFGNTGVSTLLTVMTPDTTNPSISANYNSATWYTFLRTATVTATDTGGSGLDEVRYQWGTNSLNSLCTTGGTTTVNGAILSAPTGGTTLYLCAKDTAGNHSSWSGIYRWENTRPPTPAKMTTTWNGDHFVTGAFISTTSTVTDTGGSGMGKYSLLGNSAGLSSCNQIIASNLTTPSYTVTGVNLPEIGQKRYYCWLATDIAGNQSLFVNEYVQMSESVTGTPTITPTLLINDTPLPTITLSPTGEYLLLITNAHDLPLVNYSVEINGVTYITDRNGYIHSTTPIPLVNTVIKIDNKIVSGKVENGKVQLSIDATKKGGGLLIVLYLGIGILSVALITSFVRKYFHKEKK